MRYREVVQRYLSARGASSREWALSDTLVMCVELDMSAPSYARGLFATSSSQRQKGPRFVRLTMFRVYPDRKPFLLSGSEEPPLTQIEEGNLRDVHRWVEDWICGRRDSLPPSNSTAIAECLRHDSGV
jgi:hypothetical protein